VNIWSDFILNTERPTHKWTHYFPIYEKHFERFRNQSIVFLEIGCGKGGSLQMWKRYFGPFAQIVGIDINPECKEFEEDQIAVRIGNQNDSEFIKSVISEFGVPDIVLDDGSHQMQDILVTFDSIYPKQRNNAVYCVEDLHTAYWEEFGGGLNREGTFIEVCKVLIDQLNADHTRGELVPDEFSKGTLSMHFYDSVVVFEKGRHIKKFAPVFPATEKL
jgi:SAM-dependent methyltransferase